MAGTIFDMPAPRAARSSLKYIGDSEPEEASEKEVAAEPKLRRNVVNYLEPREGIDGAEYFNCCATCVSYVPEATMRGAVRGDRCAKFGADFTVTDDSGCNMWTPSADGKPCGHCAEHAADKMVRGQRASLNPFAVNFVSNKKRRCETCRQFEYGGSKCSLMEAMNENLAAVFEMDAEVKSAGKCDMWTDFPPPEAT